MRNNVSAIAGRLPCRDAEPKRRPVVQLAVEHDAILYYLIAQ